MFKKVLLGIIFWGITFNVTVHADHFNLYLSHTPIRQINVKDQFNTLYRSEPFLSFGFELETTLNAQMQWSVGLLHSPDQKYNLAGGQATYSSTSYYYKIKYTLVDLKDYFVYAGVRASLEFAAAQKFPTLEGVDVGTGAGILLGVESSSWFGEYGYFFSTPSLRFTGGFTDSYQDQTEFKAGYRLKFNLIDLFPAS